MPALPALQQAVSGLTLVDRARGCTADLGPRWLVAYSHDGDLTGVVVDDYGCRDVRITANPVTRPAGDGQDPGTVRGVLDGGSALLLALGLSRETAYRP